MSSSIPTYREFCRRYRRALAVPFSLEKVCSQNVQDFVTPYATSLGVTDKCFFFPLLSCVASCLGTNSYVELTALWKEPPVIWTLVVTPNLLYRAGVAEHLKQQLLRAQKETTVLGNTNEDTKDHLRKFLFDDIPVSQLLDMLKLSSGHGLSVQSSTRLLQRSLQDAHDAEVLQRLHAGNSWFTDSRSHRMTLAQTRYNLAIVCSPTDAHETMVETPRFQELFHQTFLTACAEESYAKFEEFSVSSEADKMREIFITLLKLHFSHGPVVYTMSTEALEKFKEIHDELTDKARMMSRKNAHKVYNPALSYLARLSLVLHVLDGVLDAINYTVPVSHLTWNKEISATAVWQARELLGHVIEQRFALMEPTVIEATPTTTQSTPPVQQHAPAPQVQNVQHHTPNRSPYVRANTNYNTTPPSNGVRRNIMTSNYQRPMHQTQTITNGYVAPVISSVRSYNRSPAIVTPVVVPAPEPLVTQVSMSISAEDVVDDPPLISRDPSQSLQDMSDEEFLSKHRSSVKKVLRHIVGEISPSRCVQLRLVADPGATDDAEKYSLTYAQNFLKRLELLEFGVCEYIKGNKLRHFMFKKKKFSALEDKQKEILTDLSIDEEDYNKCFNSNSSTESSTPANGEVVDLE